MEKELRFVPLVVFLTSFSVLSYQIILIRIFSIIQWHNLSSLIISLALLGFGASGTFLTIFRSHIEKKFPFYLSGFLFLFPVTLGLGFIVCCRIPFNPFEIGIDPREPLYLFMYFASTGIPFFFAATVIGMALTRFPIGKTYFLNLTGSGAGAMGIILLSFLFHPHMILLIVTGIALFTATLFSLNLRKITWGSLFLISLMVIAGLYFSIDWLNLRQISPYKSLSRALLLPHARIIAERYSPLGLVQVIEAEGLRYSGDLSLLSPYQVPVQKAIFLDGDSMTMVTPFDGKWKSIGHLDHIPSSLPYHLLPPESRQKALIVGVGGGEGILKALLNGFARIDGVEINGDVIRLMKDELADFSGGIYTHPRVNIFQREARGFLSVSKKKYNLIELSLLDSYAAAASGIYGLNETYLYTVESIQGLFDHLEENGLLAITRWNVTPPRDNIKMLNLCITALERLEVRDVYRHLFYLRSMRASTIVVSKTPLTDSQIEKGKGFAETRLFDLVHYPGIRPEEANRYIRMDFPLYYEAAKSLLSPKRDLFIKSFSFDISAPRDNRPYYYNFFKWKTLPLLLHLGPQKIPFTEWGYFILIISLIPAVTLSFLLIVLPLFLSPFREKRHNLPVFLFFSSLGAGFFLVEMPLIQKFILFLHHPTYSLSVIISSLLFFSGLGSYFSDRFFDPKYRIFLSTLFLLGILGIYSLFLDPVLQWVTPQKDGIKILFTVIVLMPLGFFMGIPFPQGLLAVKNQDPLALPWAWGINGFFSVISVILAHILAIQWGFRAVLLLAAGCYLAAGVLSFRLGKGK